MKEKILKIADRLRDNEITTEDAETLLLFLFGVVRSTSKKADPKIKFNCNMCKVYYENNLNAGKVVNRCCPTCASELPSIN